MNLNLVFVYSSNGGPLSGLVDWAHTLVGPADSACRLQSLTHGMLGMKPRWRQFLNTLPVGQRFFHRDELMERYGLDLALPAVLLDQDGQFKIWISADEINCCQSLDELESLVTERYNDLVEQNKWDWLARTADEPQIAEDFTVPGEPSHHHGDMAEG